MKLRFTQAAEAEVEAAVDYYRCEASATVAKSFLAELGKTTALIKRMPHIGHPILPTFRAIRLGKFPYTVIYFIEGNLIWVHALAHQQREPHYWVSRRQK